MKTKIRLFIFSYFVLVSLVMVSCTKNFDEINTDPSRFGSATPEAIIAGTILSTNNALANGNMTHYWDYAHFISSGSRYYNLDGDNGLWKTMYVNVLQNLISAINKFEKDPGFNNRVQAMRIWKSYAYAILVSQFGVIPIDQANNPAYLNNVIFNTEDEAYIYILNELKDATSKIDPTKDKFSYDLLYNGNMASWKKLGNTLRLRIALQCMRNLGETAKTHVKEVMDDESNLINSPAETAKMNYENILGNENPYYIKYVRNGHTITSDIQRPKMSDFMLVYLNSYKDPRKSKFYEEVPVSSRFQILDTLQASTPDSSYVVLYGAPYFGRPKSNKPSFWTNYIIASDPIFGNSLTASYSNPSPAVLEATRPFTVLSYAEAEFLKAEAKELGLGGSKTSETYYYSGIDASLTTWGITTAQANAYKATNGIKWNTVGQGYNNYLVITDANIPAANINKIYVQRWLNYFPDGGFETWNLVRRTRAIKFPPHFNSANAFQMDKVADLPHRASYPTIVLNYNPVGYADALKKLGITANKDEEPTTYLKFEAPYTVTDWTPTATTYDLRFLSKQFGNTVADLKATGVPYTVVKKYKN